MRESCLDTRLNLFTSVKYKRVFYIVNFHNQILKRKECEIKNVYLEGKKPAITITIAYLNSNFLTKNVYIRFG